MILTPILLILPLPLRDVDSSIHTASIVNWTPINTHILSSTDFSPQASVQDLDVYENVQNLH